MDFNENKRKTLENIFKKYPDAISANLGGFRGDIGFWIHLPDGAVIFSRLDEPVKFAPPDGSLLWLFDE